MGTLAEVNRMIAFMQEVYSAEFSRDWQENKGHVLVLDPGLVPASASGKISFLTSKMNFPLNFGTRDVESNLNMLSGLDLSITWALYLILIFS